MLTPALQGIRLSSYGRDRTSVYLPTSTGLVVLDLAPTRATRPTYVQEGRTGGTLVDDELSKLPCHQFCRG